MGKSEFTVREDNKTLVAKRTFDAAKSKVWEAYTEAEKLEKWWGPKGWETEVKEMDFRVGGYWFYCMTCKDKDQGDWYGQSSCGKGVYETIEPKDSLSYTDYFVDQAGTITPGMPTSLTLVEFIEDGEKTTVISTSSFESPESLKQVMEMGMQEGFDQTWDNLERYLAH